MRHVILGGLSRCVGSVVLPNDSLRQRNPLTTKHPGIPTPPLFFCSRRDQVLVDLLPKRLLFCAERRRRFQVGLEAEAAPKLSSGPHRADALVRGSRGVPGVFHEDRQLRRDHRDGQLLHQRRTPAGPRDPRHFCRGHVVGTLRSNRSGLDGAEQLWAKHGMVVIERGDMAMARAGELVVIKWMDTNEVRLMTTRHIFESDWVPMEYT